MLNLVWWFVHETLITFPFTSLLGMRVLYYQVFIFFSRYCIDTNLCTLDSSIKVPNQGVFYYDLAPKEEYNLKGIIELVKPRQVCIDKSEFSIAHDLDCSLPTDILSRPMKKGGYIPIQGTLDLMNNSIMLK